MDQWTATYKIHHFQTDQEGRAKISSLVDWMQETAGDHAESLGFSQRDLHARGMLWALYRFSIQIDDVPMGGEELVFRTWVSKLEGPFSEREYKVTDLEGRVKVRATSLWFAINASTRRPQTIGKIGYSESLKRGPKSIQGPEKLFPQKAYTLLGATHANYFHLDINGHVNNVRYIDMILGAIPQMQFQSTITHLDINFLGEVTELHSEIKVLATNDHQYALQVGEAKPVVLAKITWAESGI